MPIADWSEEGVNFKWLDIVEPTEEELREVSEQYDLHRYTVRDCLEPDHLPKHEDLGDTHFIITRALTPDSRKKYDSIQEISSKVAIFYDDHFIITVHRLSQPFLQLTRDKYLATHKVKTTNELVTKIMWFVLRSYDQPALDLSAEVDHYEEKIFLHRLTPRMLEDLYYIKRKANMCFKLLVLTGEVINTIPRTRRDAVAFQDVQDLHVKLNSLFDQAQDDVTNLLNIYLSLSSQKTNEVMKVLTIFSAFFLPLTFIAGIYGMNFQFMPELKEKWGYPAVFGLMAFVSIVIYVWFKRKKWL